MRVALRRLHDVSTPKRESILSAEGACNRAEEGGLLLTVAVMPHGDCNHPLVIRRPASSTARLSIRNPTWILLFDERGRNARSLYHQAKCSSRLHSPLPPLLLPLLPLQLDSRFVFANAKFPRMEQKHCRASFFHPRCCCTRQSAPIGVNFTLRRWISGYDFG